MQYSYFPGCSLHSTAKEYDNSIHLVAETLGFSLEEINGWVCCGASSVGAISTELEESLGIKNLALAARLNNPDLVCPCAACFNRMANTNRLINEGKIESDNYHGNVKVRHLLDILVNDIGLSKIKEKVNRNIDLSVVCYYGCLLVRPRSFDNQENPESMDLLVQGIGCHSKPWGYKTECCGSDLSLSRTDIVLKLVYDILNEARDHGAEAIIVACPLCQSNLDFRQSQIEKKYNTRFDLPILYFTELMALSFGIAPKRIGLAQHIVSVNHLLNRIK